MENISIVLTAIDIKTDLWNKALEFLLENDWKLTYKYDNFDAGIDSDFFILEKNNEEILLGWTNWFEGEIQCSALQMKIIESFFGTSFKIGEPISLKPGAIELNRKWKNENTWGTSK